MMAATLAHPPPTVATGIDLSAALPDPDAPAPSVAADAVAAVAALRSAIARGRPTPAGPPAVRPAPPPASFRDRAAAGTAQREADFAGGVDVPEGTTITDIAIQVEPGVWMPVTLAIPPSASPATPAPALVWLHATGSGRGAMRARLLAAAAAGFVGVAPDARWHGDRAAAGTGGGGGSRAGYEGALVAAWKRATTTTPANPAVPPRPFLLDTDWDCQRLLDWMVMKEGGKEGDDEPTVTTLSSPLSSCILSSSIGVSGVSLGGMHAWLLTVADDRIAAAAPAIGLQSFAWAAAAEEEGGGVQGVGTGSAGAWKARAASIPAVFAAAAADRGLVQPDAPTFAAVLDAIAPGLRDAYDAPHSLAAACPRPFLIVSGGDDPRCPLPGIEWAVRRAKRVYGERKDAPPGSLRWSVYKGVGHEMMAGMDTEVLAWMGRWLKTR